ncbi:MAG: methylenetetrahydrofolate reductase C-terminal domain-containing protein [Clostridia bacterium]|jgi:NAD-dependent dihydropyrimidine dehydrogenase PreA subunit|nr:methylenetetrahydrofolate reductase C-terminal domain-containing protein [Clostridia bacterium]
MIVAEQKPFKEIVEYLRGKYDLLIVPCMSCTAVCFAGGVQQGEELASALRIHCKMHGDGLNCTVRPVTRQCDPEFIEELTGEVAQADSILSLACGVGVQFLAERYPDKAVIPALNTSFAGGKTAPGIWEERCSLCGNCVLHVTGGICPITRCAKGLLNGPCGGSEQGRCEIDPNLPCAWQLIINRMNGLGRLEELLAFQCPKDWSTGNAGGLRRLVREDLRLK